MPQVLLEAVSGLDEIDCYIMVDCRAYIEPVSETDTDFMTTMINSVSSCSFPTTPGHPWYMLHAFTCVACAMYIVALPILQPPARVPLPCWW
jgi:hypothetical protein